MEGLQEDIERLYSPGEAALYMAIERQTVTKYARLFEDQGYIFHKDEKGNRAYTDTNILMFKDLITQRNRPGVTLESAAKSLTAVYKSKSITPTDTTLPAEKERYDNDIHEKLDLLMLAFKNQQEIIEKQNETIESLKQHIDKSIVERDKRFMEHIRASQEKQKEEMLQLAAAKEEEEKKPIRKGFLSIFRKR